MNSRSSSGFTLLETLVVLVILALMLVLVAARGAPPSRGLEARIVAGEIAQVLREARARAIAADSPVNFTLDVVQHRFDVEGGPSDTIPDGLNISAVVAPSDVIGTRFAIIRFAPDGSASGGRIGLQAGGTQMRVDVDWLTGRVSVGYVQ